MWSVVVWLLSLIVVSSCGQKLCGPVVVVNSLLVVVSSCAQELCPGFVLLLSVVMWSGVV